MAVELFQKISIAAATSNISIFINYYTTRCKNGLLGTINSFMGSFLEFTFFSSLIYFLQILFTVKLRVLTRVTN